MVQVRKRRKEIYKDILKLLLRREDMCATLSEIMQHLKYNKEKEMTVVNTLSELKKADLITRRWLRAGGKKFRLYCLKRV